MTGLIHKVAACLHVDATSRDAARCAWRRFIHWKPSFYRVATSWGLNQEPRDVSIVVSLTSYPGRITTVDQTVNTLLNQTIQPDKIVLWLAKEQFPHEERDLPPRLIEQKNYGLEIRWCEDLRSYKKLLPALRAFPEAAIVTVDDDLFYHPDMIAELLESYRQDRRCVHTQGAMQIAVDATGAFMPYRQWKYSMTLGRTSPSQLILGGTGTLYPPHCFDDEIFNQKVFRDIAPAADDMWFWAMAIRNGYNIRLAHGGRLGCATNYNANASQALWNSNRCAQNGNDDQLYRILERYPGVRQTLMESLVR